MHRLPRHAGTGTRGAYGPVTITRPSRLSAGSDDESTIRNRWWTSVGPALTIALIGQYFVADSAIDRRTFMSSTFVPSTTWTISIHEYTCGYSDCCVPRASARYAVNAWRFFTSRDTTSIALQATSDARSASVGRGPASPSPSSSTTSWPD